MLSRSIASAVVLASVTVATSSRADVRVYDSQDPDHPKTFDLYGWIQPRFSYQQQDTRPTVKFEPNPGFSVRRFRFGGIAVVDTWLTARFELELAGSVAPTPLLDAYVVAQPIDEIGLMAGQMRVPFSRQNLLPSKNLQLPDAAYWVDPVYIVDRDMGAMLTGSFFEQRIRYYVGLFDGNANPARGQQGNNDPYFLYAARLELQPLGAAPRFEGDLRPVADRKEARVHLAGSAMKNHDDDKGLQRTYLGADLGAWWYGLSLYAEYYRRHDEPASAGGTQAATTAEGINVQLGIFPPIAWVEDHVEIAGRIERFDPAKGRVPVSQDERDIYGSSNSAWGQQGFLVGLNFFARSGHDVKIQTSYEFRNELKKCLQNQVGDQCNGFIKNDLFLVQATGAF